eukprot:sb/3475321/
MIQKAQCSHTVPYPGTQTSKQAVRTQYVGHVTGHQPIKDQYFLMWPGRFLYNEGDPKGKIFPHSSISCNPKCDQCSGVNSAGSVCEGGAVRGRLVRGTTYRTGANSSNVAPHTVGGNFSTVSVCSASY